MVTAKKALAADAKGLEGPAADAGEIRPGSFVWLYWTKEQGWTGQHIGDGGRGFLVLALGRKWATLLYPPMMARVRLPVQELLRYGKPVPNFKARRMLQRLRRMVKERRYNGLPHKEAKELAKQAASVLRQQSV